ncbi:MAG: ABC transporter substrate-binding protein [Chloroflexi bacterium]|nr:ABC transporter substrate-binding protein [Chloroflexota bacterium]
MSGVVRACVITVVFLSMACQAPGTPPAKAPPATTEPAPAAPAIAPATPAQAAAAAPQAPLPALSAPQRGGVLHFPVRQSMDTLDPHKGQGFSPLALAWPRQEPLVIYKRAIGLDHRIDNELQGDLAESWVLEGDRTYVFMLRKGVKWDDGVEFTADDVLFTFQFVGDLSKGYRARQFVSGVQTITALDKYTVRVELKQPNQGFLTGITDLYMLPKHVADRGDSFDKVSVGTGPFKVTAFDSRAGFAMERNADYWDAPRPALNGLVGHYGLDDSGMLAAFLAQQIDLLTVDAKQLQLVKQSVPEVQVFKFMADYGNSLYMNVTRAPYNDVRVRRAMHLALDRNAMNQTLTGGEGIISPPGVSAMKDGYALAQDELLKLPGYNAATKQQDIAEARRLLTEAGYPNGFDDKIIFSRAASTTPPIAEMVSSQLKAIGVNLTLDGLDAAVYNDRDVKGDYNIQICFCYRMDLNARERLRTGEPVNTGKVSDPELDRILNALDASTDPTTSKKIARDLQLYLLDTLYFVPTIEIPFFPLAQPWVRNYVFGYGNPHAAPYFVNTDIWLDTSKMPAARRDETPKLGGR